MYVYNVHVGKYKYLRRLLSREPTHGKVCASCNSPLSSTGSFEVKIDSVLIFSKLEKGSFPDFEETVASVESASAGGKPKMVEKVQPSLCTIL